MTLAHSGPNAEPVLSPEEKLKAREDFFKLMSHEIRTPLNGVMGMLSLLSRTSLTPDQASYIATAKESGDHLLTLVNDLLDYARIDAGKIELETSQVYLEPLLQSVAELLSPRAHANAIEIAWSLDQRLDHIQADEGRLRQILFNLAGNAIKFTKKGGVLIHVGLTDDSLIRFSIRDTGPGIPPEARERIFEEYGQVSPSDATRYGGAGLGLVVVKKLVEVMQGNLTLESELGEGSIFSVTFRAPYGLRIPNSTPQPRIVTLVSHNDILAMGAKSHLATFDNRLRHLKRLDELVDSHAILLCDRAALDHGPIAAPSSKAIILLAPEQRDEIEDWRAHGWAGYLIKPLRRASLIERLDALNEQPNSEREPHRDDERIVVESAPDKLVLLVEDNPVNALLAQILLQREGCRVERASSGEEAVHILQSRPFDLIFMDLGLPGLDGIGATRRVRSLGITTPIIALTANAYEEDRRACLSAGMNDFLTKPIELVALKARLQSWTSKVSVAE